MTDKTIGDLTEAGALDGTELVHVVQGGNSRKTDIEDIRRAVLPNVVARYWRLADLRAYRQTDGTALSPSAAEIEFRATIGGARLTGTAAAATNFDASTDAAKAQDGDTATLWAAVIPSPNWYQLDLGAGNENTFRELVIRARTGSFSNQTPRLFEIWSSDDGVRWRIHGGFQDTGGEYTGGEARTFDVSAITR
jgi:hypothetical protein